MLISIKSLGCSKNFVDSEVMCGYLLKNDHHITNKIEESDAVIINTCSFIQPAVEESIDTILEAVKLKEEGKLKFIIVAGCLPQRYAKKELAEALTEVDAFIGIDQINQISQIIAELPYKKTYYRINSHPCFIYNEKSPRLIMSPHHYAYIKISEGCNNQCSYCLIPQIKGTYRSRTIHSILSEVKQLAKHHPLKEIIIVAEDTTYYGTDLYGKPFLSELLEKLSYLPWKDLVWIRLMYTHPAHYSERLIDIIAQNKLICPYLDLPLQHISDTMLKGMNRNIKKKEIISLIEKLRKIIPQLTIRTTFIVGFPGETEKHFQELCDFVKQYRFEKMGVFPFYDEKECAAHHFRKKIPEKVKRERRKTLMGIQQNIALDHQKAKIGKNIKVLIDEVVEGNPYILIGRSYAEAPEIDGDIRVKNGKQKDIGKFLNVRINHAYPYRLEGEKV